MSATTSQRILLCEDEIDLGRTVAYTLQKDGFAVTHTATGQGALDASQTGVPFDLVVLDLMLPDMSGIEVCRRMRASSRTRNILILMATARGEEIDRVVGFEVGADDYIVKPYSVRELALRIRALLRRSAPAPRTQEVLIAGPFRLDTAAHRCWIDDEPASLTAVEMRLLTQLMVQRGRVLTRPVLLARVWPNQPEVGERTVDANIKRMREKLGQAGAWIQSLRGVGYRFAESLEDGDDEPEWDPHV